MYVSDDGMFTWAAMNGTPLSACVPSCSISDIEFDPADHHYAWAIASQAGAFPFKVWNSTQANLDTAAWKDVTPSAPTLDPTKTQVTSVAPNPFNNKVAYISLS